MKFVELIVDKLSEHNAFLVLLAVYFFLGTFMLDNYPRVWVDEPWESITASTLLSEGKMYNPVLENYSGFDKILLQPRLLINTVLAPTFALLGVGSVQGRLASVMCGALLLLAVYRLTRRSFSQRAALLATWFVSIETMMFISYRTIRPEIYLVTLESFSLMFLLEGFKKNSLRLFILSGLCSGVALWTHPNAILHIAAVAVLFVLTYRMGTFTSRFAWTFVGAVFIAVVPYLIYVAVNDAHNSFSTFYLQLDNRTSALARQNWLLTSLQGEWNRIVEYTQFPSRIFIVLILASVWVYSLISKIREARYVAIAIAVHGALSLVIISNKTILYASSILPMLCILAAVTVDDCIGSSQTIRVRIRRLFQRQYLRESIGIVLFIVLSLNQLGGDAQLLWRNRNCSYTETIQALQSAIPANARVWCSMTFWFGFQHQPLRTQYTYLREVETFKPEYIITGDSETWGKEFWKPVRDKAAALIAERGTLVAELPENCYGTLRVYRLRW